MRLVTWPRRLTEDAPPRCRHCSSHGAGCANDTELRQLLTKLERASAWIANHDGDPVEVLRGAS